MYFLQEKPQYSIFNASVQIFNFSLKRFHNKSSTNKMERGKFLKNFTWIYVVKDVMWTVFKQSVCF